MRRRFDAANTEAKNRRQVRYDARGTRQAEEDKRWARPAPAPTEDTTEAGENDSTEG
jgi:hypothetical protein